MLAFRLLCNDMRLPHAEAHAALAAVEWASGQKGLAEDHFDKAVNLDARWSKIGYIRQQTRWPPALYSTMERFLSIASVDDDRITASKKSLHRFTTIKIIATRRGG